MAIGWRKPPSRIGESRTAFIALTGAWSPSIQSGSGASPGAPPQSDFQIERKENQIEHKEIKVQRKEFQTIRNEIQIHSPCFSKA
jgi:hypothetical protein